MNEGLKELYDIDHLRESFDCTRQGTDWKESVQRYEIDLLERLTQTSKELREGTYKFKPVIEFKLSERGHVRFIKSHHISDRVVLLCFVKFVLLPKVLPKVIYDNSASITGRGVSFARKRLAIHLNSYYKKFGNQGYIRLFDFSKFYDNIPHDKALKAFKPLLNEDEYRFLVDIFKHFEVDLSVLSDEEFKKCRDGVFNSLDYIWIESKQRTGEKLLKKSVGIGSPVSQTVGIFYPYMIDNYVKIVRNCKYYGRYNDDFYIIGDSLQELDSVTDGIRELCRRYGLILNPKKIRTVPLTKEFTYLKIIYRLRHDGKVIRRITRKALARERKKLRKFKKLELKGLMTREYALECYKSWRGGCKKINSKKQIYKMDRYFCNLFGYERMDKPWKMKKDRN